MLRERTVRRTAPLAVTVALLAALSLLLAPGAAANGNGVTVYLGYLPEVSNWGPYEATGEAYVNAGEGRAHVTVDHMIHDPAMRYEVWLVHADDRDTLFSMGTFAVDATGHADVELHNPNLKPAEFRFLVISAEPLPDGDPRPDARRTVAGVFPNAKARAVTGGAAGFDDIWGQEQAPMPASSAVAAEPTGDDTALPAGQAEGTPASPPRLPITGGGLPVPRTPLLAVAGAASIALVVSGVCSQRAAARARRDVSRGDAR